MKLFYKKVSRVKGRMPLSLAADSETIFAFAKRRMGEFSTITRSKRGKPSPGVSLKKTLSTDNKAVIAQPFVIFISFFLR